jgi:hypothetical protein
MKFPSPVILLAFLLPTLLACGPNPAKSTLLPEEETPSDTLFVREDLGLIKSGSEQNVYTLNFALSRLNCRIQLNGIDFVETIHGEPKQGKLTNLNSWIMPGENVLKITLDTLIKSSQKSEQIASFSLFPSIRASELGDSLLLWEYFIPDSSREWTYPAHLEFSFRVDDVPPSRFWEEAEEIRLDASTKAEINQLILDIHTAISQKDTTAFFNLFDYQIEDVMRYYFNQESFKNTWKRGIASRLQTIRVFRLDPSEYVYHLVADKKIVYVEAEGQSPVRSPDGRSRIPILLGKVDGKIRLVW